MGERGEWKGEVGKGRGGRGGKGGEKMGGEGKVGRRWERREGREKVGEMGEEGGGEKWEDDGKRVGSFVFDNQQLQQNDVTMMSRCHSIRDKTKQNKPVLKVHTLHATKVDDC